VEELAWMKKSREMREAREAREREQTPGSTDDVSTPGVRPQGGNVSQIFDEDLIPENDLPQRTDQDDAIDRLIDSIGIVDAYQRWCGKSEVKGGNRTDGIKVSCPNPQHPDTNPSAWLNTDKDVWACGACGASGGDVYDIAAWHFGFPVPDYKVGKKFHELRERMAVDLGYKVTKTLAGNTKIEPLAETESGECNALVVEAISPSLAETDLSESPPEDWDDESNDGEIPNNIASFLSPDEEPDVMPEIEWRKILVEDSFLRTWMEATTVDDLPEEYYFWLGLMALGFAGGYDVVLEDNPVVKSNLYICLFGPTGIGKSRSIVNFSNLLHEALPFNEDEEFPTGVRMTGSPGSPESLLDAFSKGNPDPANPKEMESYASVRGLVKFDELATLIGRSERIGNSMKPMLMDLYDAYARMVHTTRGHGTVIAERPFVGTLTTTQPRAIRNLVREGDVASGFLNRWIFAAGMRKPAISHAVQRADLTDSINALKTVNMHYRVMVPPTKIHPGPRSIELKGDALNLWSEFFFDQIDPLRDDETQELLSRAALTMKKLMLLFSINEMQSEITVNAVESAISLWGYLQKSYGLLSGSIGVPQVDECMKQICSAIERLKTKKRPATKRNIRRSLSDTKYPSELFLRSLKVALELEVIVERVHTQKNGTSTEVYAVPA
jgi:hypothetical protein